MYNKKVAKVGESMIRQVIEQDYPVINNFLKKAFQIATVSNGTEQDFLDYLRTIPENDNQYEYIYVLNHQVIGYVKLNITFIGKDKVFLLAPLAIGEDYCHQTIGTQLIQYALQQAKRTGIDTIFLVGDPNYYGRFGFYPTKWAYNAKIDNQFVLELSLNKNKQYHGILNIYEMPKTIVIDGKKIQNKEDFYQEIEKKFTKNLLFKMGHNLDALQDILDGGYGVYAYHEPIIVIWKNFTVSLENLKNEMQDILDVFQTKKHIQLKKKG